jgi:hypothetical protein
VAAEPQAGQIRVRERERAERCFALARSTTFAGERENAIARGKAIAQAAGLPFELFDIPGETRTPPASRFSDDLFTRPRSPFYAGGWTREDLDDVLSRYREQVEADERRASESDLGRVRRERAERVNQLRDALNHLWRAGVRIYPWSGEAFGVDTLFIAPEVSAKEYDREAVLELARARGWPQ